MVKGRPPSFLPALMVYHAVNDGMLASMSAMFPVLAKVEGFGLTYENIGLLTSLGLMVTIVFQMISGTVGDRRDAQYLMAGGILLLGLCSIMVTQAYSYITLLAVVLVLRVGASFYHPVGIAWISKRYSGADLDRSMGYQSAMGDAGVLIAFVSTGFIAIQWGWQVPFVIWGIGNIVAAILGLATRYDTKVPGQDRPQGPKPRVRTSLLFKGFKFAVLPLAVTGAAYTVTTNFGPLLITDPEVIGQSADVAGYVVALWIGTGVISATLFGRISSALGRKRTLMMCFILMTVATAVIGLTDQLWLICVMMVVFGFFLFMTWPGLFAMISEATGKVSQGFIFGVIFAGHIIGGASIAYIAGLSADLYGIGSPFLMLSVLVVLPLFSLALYQEPKRPGEG